MRTSFDDQLKQLNSSMISLGALCEDAIAKATKSFLDNDIALAESIVSVTERIDHEEREIESLCIKLLLMQQPVARDLRTISAALKMVTDLERIGTQSADIAEIVATVKFPSLIRADTIHDMALSSIKMVNDSIDAFLHSNTEEAKNVIQYDDVVDNYFTEVKQDLIRRIQTSPQEGEYAIDLLMIAKYLERIADHAVNISKWVLFSVSGEIN